MNPDVKNANANKANEKKPNTTKVPQKDVGVQGISHREVTTGV
jgi:hypothetical protein